MNHRSYSRNNYPYTATTSNENYGDSSMTDSWNRHRNSGMDDSYSQRDWIDPSTPYGYSSDVSYYNQPSYTPQPSAEPPSSTFATTNYYHDYSLPAEEFQSLVRGSKVDYIISTTRELDEYLSGTTMYVLGQTENYRVWKVV